MMNTDNRLLTHDKNLTTSQHKGSCNDVEEGRFSGTISTKDGNKITFPNGKIDMIQNNFFGVKTVINLNSCIFEFYNSCHRDKLTPL